MTSTHRVSTFVRLVCWRSGALLSVLAASSACLDPVHEQVVSARPISAGESHQLAPGESIQLGIQLLDKDQHGVDDLDCLFVVSAPELLSFNLAAPGANSLRVRTSHQDALGANLDGVALATLTAHASMSPSDVTVYAGLASSDDLAEKHEASASMVWSFVVRTGLDAGVDASTDPATPVDTGVTP